jgi:predicted dehydrogenase
MNELNWGIIGCGNVTEVKSGPAFNKVPHSRLQAVMRRDAALAANYAQRHGVPQWYSDASQLINDPLVNAIYIATPPASHEQYALAAIAAGKPVYLEKPMALSAASARRIAAEAKKLNVRLSVAHYRREQPLYKYIKQCLNENKLGDIRCISLRLHKPLPEDAGWRVDPGVSGGGLFHDLAPHQLDILYTFFGRPRVISSVALNQQQKYPVPDLVAGHLLFNDTLLADGLWTFGAPDKTDTDICEIAGTKGSISFNFFGQPACIYRTAGREETISFEPLAHVQQPMIAAVSAFFRGESDNPCTGEEGAEVMEIIEELTQST